MNVRLYILQRATAAIMAPLVLAHLVVIFYATSRGLSAAEILGRTRGSVGWGRSTRCSCWRRRRTAPSACASWRRNGPGSGAGRLDILMWGFGLVLAGAGPRAVAAVVL